MKIRIFCACFLMLGVNKCDPPQSESFDENPDARRAFEKLTDDGKSFPDALEFAEEVNSPGRAIQPPCRLSEDDFETNIQKASYNANGFTARKGEYNLSKQDRAELVRDLIAEGKRLGKPPKRAGTTTMKLGGQTYDVMNDAVTLPDGTYINLTFQESMDLAQAYGCRLPNLQEARAIRRFAEEGRDGAIAVKAQARTNDSPGMKAMNAMMNDDDLHELARRGQGQLINGHMKWYIDDGSGSFKFYGFRAPPSCYGSSSTAYCQNGGSGGHGNHHIDYSQSARFICPKGVRI